MLSPHLCTTALTEFWDRQADKIVFLGAWCLRYDRRYDWKDLNYEILPHPWDDREGMHRAAWYEDEVYEELLEVLGAFLNDVHGEKHNKGYWRLIIGPWLQNYVQTLHERYLCLNRAFDRFSDLNTIGLAPSSFKTPRHTWDHIQGIMGDAYSLQVYTVLLQAMGHQMPVHDAYWNWDQWLSGNARSSWIRLLKKLLPLWHKLGPCWARKAPVIMVDMYIPIKQVIQLMIRTGFQARWCILPKPEKWIDGISQHNMHPRRHDLGNLSIERNDSFRSVLIKTLALHLPLIYLEGYRPCREWVKHKFRESTIRKIMTANALLGNETFKFLAAQLKEGGSKLVAIQHGGSYGSALYNPIEYFERKAADEFWSWGWGGEESGVKPMPNPKLSLLASDRRGTVGKNAKKYLFFVGNALPRYNFSTYSVPAVNQRIRYLEWQISFLKELQTHIFAKVVFRPFPNDHGWALRQRLQDACPELYMDDPHNDYYAGLIEASLVICDMNQTTILEALAANIPTIAFWNPSHWELRPKAEPYFQFLRDVGILHNTPSGAAEAINNIWPGVEHWWMQRWIQEAREKFVNRYALNSQRWLQEWREALCSNV